MIFTTSELITKMGINNIQMIEQRMLEIEQMDKTDLSLDDQFALIAEYDGLWKKVQG